MAVMNLPRVTIQTDDFDLSTEVARLREGDTRVGAVCAFVGTVRDRNDGQSVKTLELEHYPGMTEDQLHRLARDAASRHGALAVLVHHRVEAVAGEQRRHRRAVGHIDLLEGEARLLKKKAKAVEFSATAENSGGRKTSTYRLKVAGYAVDSGSRTCVLSTCALNAAGSATSCEPNDRPGVRDSHPGFSSVTGLPASPDTRTAPRT